MDLHASDQRVFLSECRFKCPDSCRSSCVVSMAAGQTDGGAPLFIAAASGHAEIVRTLVRAGVAVKKAKVGDHRQCN